MFNISLYPDIRATRTDKVVPVDIFFEDVRTGKWQDIALKVRCEPDHDKRTLLKQQAPYVTLAGTFEVRNNSGLTQHSGLLGMDLDDIEDINEVKSRICCDPHVFACFMSISGRGLCVVFRINPEKHLESFLGLQDYIYTNYNEPVDIHCKDVSRPRYVSWDPDIYINFDAKKFTQYPKKDTIKEPVHKLVFVQTDFDTLVQEITTRRIDITGGYRNWLKVGFGLADKFGESGRQYFHLLSQFNSGYSPKQCDKQYKNCLKAGKAGITIASLYFLAKEAGIPIVSAETRLISTAAAMAKKGGRNKEDTVKLVADQTGLDGADIVNQVFDQGATPVEIEDLIDQCKIWLQSDYQLRYNQVTGLIENAGAAMVDRDKNDLYIKARQLFPKLSKEIVTDLLESNFVTAYHPIKAFFARYDGLYSPGQIDALFGCINTPTGWDGYAAYFGKKWLVGMIANLYGGNTSPLFPVLCGEKVGTGKTRFFQDILPEELKPYFAIKSLSTQGDTARKDLEIATSRYFLILDDEMSGKSKRDEKAIKALLSMPDSTHRAAFARTEERRVRLCGFCGSSNDLAVLGWDVGPQRRTIPIEVLSIDFSKLNAISKILVWLEAYHLYRSGFNYEVLGDDVVRLHEATGGYMQTNAELELLCGCFRAPGPGDISIQHLSASQIRAVIQHQSKETLNFNKLAKALKDLGIERSAKRVKGQVVYVYDVVTVES